MMLTKHFPHIVTVSVIKIDALTLSLADINDESLQICRIFQNTSFKAIQKLSFMQYTFSHLILVVAVTMVPFQTPHALHAPMNCADKNM